MNLPPEIQVPVEHELRAILEYDTGDTFAEQPQSIEFDGHQINFADIMWHLSEQVAFFRAQLAATLNPKKPWKKDARLKNQRCRIGNTKRVVVIKYTYFDGACSKIYESAGGDFLASLDVRQDGAFGGIECFSNNIKRVLGLK